MKSATKNLAILIAACLGCASGCAQDTADPGDSPTRASEKEEQPTVLEELNGSRLAFDRAEGEEHLGCNDGPCEVEPFTVCDLAMTNHTVLLVEVSTAPAYADRSSCPGASLTYSHSLTDVTVLEDLGDTGLGGSSIELTLSGSIDRDTMKAARFVIIGARQARNRWFGFQAVEVEKFEDLDGERPSELERPIDLPNRLQDLRREVRDAIAQGGNVCSSPRFETYTGDAEWEDWAFVDPDPCASP